MDAPYRETLPVALPLSGRNVLLIGGDDEALDKAQKLVRIGARVTVVAERVVADLASEARSGRLLWFARPFTQSDLIGVHLVMLADRNEELAQQLLALKRVHGYWLCAIDQPDLSDVYLVSIVRRGPVQIGISTGGGAPLLARRIRQALEGALDDGFGDFAHNLAALRRELTALPKEERKQALTDALRGFAMDVTVSYPEAQGARSE